MSQEINKPDASTYFLAYGPDGTRHIGVTGPDQVTTTGQPSLIIEENPNAFANEVQTAGVADFNPLPDEGAELTEGEIYTFGGGLVIVRQSHVRTIHDPDTVPALFLTYRADADSGDWIDNESVLAGEIRNYGGATYKCLQSHVTQAGWEPPNVPALWVEVIEITGDWAPGVAVEVGDEVMYEDTLYRCLQAHTTQAGWTPPVVPALWEVVV